MDLHIDESQESYLEDGDHIKQPKSSIQIQQNIQDQNQDIVQKDDNQCTNTICQNCQIKDTKISKEQIEAHILHHQLARQANKSVE